MIDCGSNLEARVVRPPKAMVRGGGRGRAPLQYDGDLSLPLGLALGSPIFPSGCEGKLGVALESLQGRRDLSVESCGCGLGPSPVRLG